MMHEKRDVPKTQRRLQYHAGALRSMSWVAAKEMDIYDALLN